jgi:phospholipase A1/A2
MPLASTRPCHRPAALAHRNAWPLLAGCALAACLPMASAAERAADCAGIDADAERLACYDHLHGRAINPADGVHAATVDMPPLPAHGSDTRSGGTGIAQAPGTLAPSPSTPQPASPLDEVWELDAAGKRGTFHLLPHRANYLLLGRYSDDPNTTSGSSSLGHSVEDPVAVDATEAKFQFSVKVKAWENLFGDNGDLWFAYTQQSNWQVYNHEVSSPFRETNYEPEAILSLRTDAQLLGWRWRLLNLGFAHQSNGRALPLSRSWNRVYAEFGFERGDWTVLARPWYRLPESRSSDDNPDIRDYLGSGDLRVVYGRGGNLFSALGRYGVSGGRGALQLEWAFPISGALKGYVQATSGYGESLVDYNHKQNTIGVGILLVPWE